MTHWIFRITTVNGSLDTIRRPCAPATEDANVTVRTVFAVGVLVLRSRPPAPVSSSIISAAFVDAPALVIPISVPTSLSRVAGVATPAVFPSDAFG